MLFSYLNYMWINDSSFLLEQTPNIMTKNLIILNFSKKYKLV